MPPFPAVGTRLVVKRRGAAVATIFVPEDGKGSMAVDVEGEDARALHRTWLPVYESGLVRARKDDPASAVRRGEAGFAEALEAMLEGDGWEVELLR